MTTTHERTTAFGLRRVFMEDEGRLHLVWRVALYLLSWWIVFFVAVIVGTLVASLLHWPDRGKNAVAVVTAIPLLIGWTWFYRRRVDRRPWRGVGLTAVPAGLPDLGVGFLAGTILVGAWFLIDLALGWVRVVGGEPATSGLPLAVGFIAVGLAGNAGAGFLEEIGYRGYVLQNLASRMPLWAATPLSAFLFAIVVHFNKLTPFFVVVATAIGVLFALTRLATARSGSPSGCTGRSTAPRTTSSDWGTRARRTATPCSISSSRAGWPPPAAPTTRWRSCSSSWRRWLGCCGCTAVAGSAGDLV